MFYIYSFSVVFFSFSLLSFSSSHTPRFPPISLSIHRIITTTAVLLTKGKASDEKEKRLKTLSLSSSNLLDLVERVVVGLHAGVVGLLEADDDRVKHGSGLVDGDDLAGVVEPVALGAEDLDLLEKERERERKKEREKESERKKRASRKKERERVERSPGSAAEKTKKARAAQREKQKLKKHRPPFRGLSEPPFAPPVRSRTYPTLTVEPRLGPIWGLGAAGAAAPS